MSLFRREKAVESPKEKLDELLAQVPPPPPPPEPMFILNIVLDVETIKSSPMTARAAQTSMENWSKNGVYMSYTKTGHPSVFYPPHRIFEIRAEEVK